MSLTSLKKDALLLGLSQEGTQEELSQRIQDFRQAQLQMARDANNNDGETKQPRKRTAGGRASTPRSARGRTPEGRARTPQSARRRSGSSPRRSSSPFARSLYDRATRRLVRHTPEPEPAEEEEQEEEEEELRRSPALEDARRRLAQLAMSRRLTLHSPKKECQELKKLLEQAYQRLLHLEARIGDE